LGERLEIVLARNSDGPLADRNGGESESALLASKTSLVRELQLVLLQLVVLDGRQPTVRSWHASGGTLGRILLPEGKRDRLT
jgi:hypothetical protein